MCRVCVCMCAIFPPGWWFRMIPKVVWHHRDGPIIVSGWWFGTAPMVFWYHPDGGLVPSARCLLCFSHPSGPARMVLSSFRDGPIIVSRWWFGTILMVVSYDPTIRMVVSYDPTIRILHHPGSGVGIPWTPPPPKK